MDLVLSMVLEIVELQVLLTFYNLSRLVQNNIILIKIKLRQIKCKFLKWH